MLEETAFAGINRLPRASRLCKTEPGEEVLQVMIFSQRQAHGLPGLKSVPGALGQDLSRSWYIQD